MYNYYIYIYIFIYIYISIFGLPKRQKLSSLLTVIASSVSASAVLRSMAYGDVVVNFAHACIRSPTQVCIHACIFYAYPAFYIYARNERDSASDARARLVRRHVRPSPPQTRTHTSIVPLAWLSARGAGGLPAAVDARLSRSRTHTRTRTRTTTERCSRRT